ncbi:hypothetical protein NDU88_008956 [Pleurodeles waltl]|uniref:Uncharacterized protein n=1 Tax=Pleurodeles waltl TaxID=8319 RepID=A0AAV7RWZ9_PLEWA|nr:hypothetical protein NDU88_008956 [Pleurodeles waltl]
MRKRGGHTVDLVPPPPWHQRSPPPGSQAARRRYPTRLIIACLLRHRQTRQLLQEARSHSPFLPEGYEVRIAADFSKETNDRCKPFLSLRPRLRQLEVKYGLFEPARMWVTKDSKSQDFYKPEELRLYLD